MGNNRRKIRIENLNSENSLYILLFIFVWTYIWLRAGYTQLTHDETATFFRYVQLGKFLPFDSEWSANNHILNSFLSYIFYKIFGPHTLVLRLANVLSFPLFFYFLVKTAGFIHNRTFRISLIVILSLTHNFIEFFAMSRGYGLSMAFLMASVWHLILSLQHLKLRDHFLSLLYAVIALTANLTLLNTLLIFIFLLFLRTISSEKRKDLRYWVSIMIAGLIPVVFFTLFLLELKERGELYYGLTTGFWEVTVRTIINTILDPGSYVIEIFAGLYFAFVIFFGLYFVFRKFTLQVFFRPHLIFFFLLTGNIVAAFFLRYLFGVNYPEDRTGLYFVVYFIAGIIFTADLIREKWQFRGIYLLIVPLFFIPVHFIINLNLTHNSFENHKIPKSFYETIESAHGENQVPPTIGGYKAREFRWAWHNYRHGGKLGKVHGSLYPSVIEDFQIVDSAYHPNWKDYYEVAGFHAQSGFYLLKRKESAAKEFAFKKEDITTGGITDGEYFTLIESRIDSIENTHVQIICDLYFDTKAKPFKSWLVASVRNEKNEEIRYEYFALDWLKYNWEGQNGHVKNTMIVPFPEDAHKLVFYVWNVLKVPYSLEHGSVGINKYRDF